MSVVVSYIFPCFQQQLFIVRTERFCHFLIQLAFNNAQYFFLGNILKQAASQLFIFIIEYPVQKLEKHQRFRIRYLNAIFAHCVSSCLSRYCSCNINLTNYLSAPILLIFGGSSERESRTGARRLFSFISKFSPPNSNMSSFPFILSISFRSVFF